MPNRMSNVQQHKSENDNIDRAKAPLGISQAHYLSPLYPKPKDLGFTGRKSDKIEGQHPVKGYLIHRVCVHGARLIADTAMRYINPPAAVTTTSQKRR